MRIYAGLLLILSLLAGCSLVLFAEFFRFEFQCSSSLKFLPGGFLFFFAFTMLRSFGINAAAL